MILSYHPAVRAEAGEAADWYTRQRDELLAHEFERELEATLLLVARHPGIGTPARRQSRAFRLNRFPYTIIYRLQGETIRVLAIAHQSRRPGYWARRT